MYMHVYDYTIYSKSLHYIREKSHFSSVEAKKEAIIPSSPGGAGRCLSRHPSPGS